MKKTSKISFFLFVFFYNYLWLRILIFPNLYNNFGTTGFIMFIFIMLGIISITLFIPKKIFKINFSKQYNDSWYRWLNCLLIILETIINICFTVYFLNKVFIEESNIYMILILIGIGVILVSNLLPNEIIDLSTLFHICGLVLIGISLIVTPKMEIDYLFIVKDINVWFIVIFVSFIIVDNLKILINKDFLDIQKSNFIMPIIFSILLCIIEYGFLIMTVGDKALLKLTYVGFLELSFMPVTKYFGDFNFVYIYLLLICVVFKNSFNVSLVKNSIDLNKNVFNLILIFVLFLCSTIILNCIEISRLYLYLVLVVLLNAGIFWMIGKCYFVREG